MPCSTKAPALLPWKTIVTGGGVNPTSTIQAVALYIADQIKQRLATLFD